MWNNRRQPPISFRPGQGGAQRLPQPSRNYGMVQDQPGNPNIMGNKLPNNNQGGSNFGNVFGGQAMAYSVSQNMHNKYINHIKNL